uniref:HNH nuclease domain-containing protein n=1 Tax=Desulfovibrio sp. U5L TaxID=596152 RepID=I2Q059_9BACT
MAYWWVNQNQTSKHEISGGYVWSPKRKRDGGRNQFYENMRDVQVGDIIFSFFGSKIQYIGIATGVAIACPKPNEFGTSGDSWSNDGWFIPIQWIKNPTPFQPKELIAELQPHLPGRYSPVQRDTGNGLQGVYLAYVPEDMADVLMRKMGNIAQEALFAASSKMEDYGAIRRVDEIIENVIRDSTSIDATEKEALIKARIGQGKFRQNVKSVERCCRLTGVTDIRLLRASHIKPWRICVSDEERLDGYNGLLLTPTMDHLFDKGLISFSDDGDLLVSPGISFDQLILLGINPSKSINVGGFAPKQAVYLAYHRDNIFQKRVFAIRG